MTKVEQIADFLMNGIDNLSVDEAANELINEHGLMVHNAINLVESFMQKFNANPCLPNDELFPLIERFL